MKHSNRNKCSRLLITIGCVNVVIFYILYGITQEGRCKTFIPKAVRHISM